MAEKKTGKKVEKDVWRILAVMLGVLGACWLFAVSWNEVYHYIVSYTVDQNFFFYFFGRGIFPVASLFTAILFLIVSLRDLQPIAKGFALASAIISAIAFVAYVVYFGSTVKAIADLLSQDFVMNAGRFMMLIAYFLFAMYCRNGGGIRNVAWVFTLIAVVITAVALVYGLIVSKFSLQTIVDQLIIILAHLAMMYCGLRKY